MFYRVDKALLVPSVMAEDWRLRVHGMVEREITLDYDQLLSRPLIERDITLTCVSNPVGGRYVGNARWIGAPLRDLLDEVGVEQRADQIVTRSVDGFTVGTPTAVATDGRDAMLAVAMNGEPLPLAHGFPVRMIVPGLYGYVSATKWLVDMELTTFDAFDPYWIERGWAERAPIKTMSRIDTPTSFIRVPAGEVPVAGVAWAQGTGIDRSSCRSARALGSPRIWPVRTRSTRGGSGSTDGTRPPASTGCRRATDRSGLSRPPTGPSRSRTVPRAGTRSSSRSPDADAEGARDEEHDEPSARDGVGALALAWSPRAGRTREPCPGDGAQPAAPQPFGAACSEVPASGAGASRG